jgi:hypothetical protein
MMVEINFDRDKRFKLVDIAHRGTEGNTTVLRTTNVVFLTTHGSIFRGFICPIDW